MYNVIVDYAPAFELISSFRVFSLRSLWKSSDLGPEWVKTITKSLRPGFQTQLEDAYCKASSYISMLAHLCPEPRNVEHFLDWLASLSPGDMFEKLSPYAASHLPKDLGAIKEFFVDSLAQWNAQYFDAWYTNDNHSLLAGNAEECRRLVRQSGLRPMDEVTGITGGLVVEPSDLSAVILVPGFHSSPSVLYDKMGQHMLITYSVDAPEENSFLPPKSLTRMTKALADTNRLAILKYLTTGPKTFSEIVEFIGLSKSVVHYHLVQLRASGLALFRINAANEPDKYSISDTVTKQVEKSLAGFLGN